MNVKGQSKKNLVISQNLIKDDRSVLEITAYIIGFDPVNLRCLSSAGLVNTDLGRQVK